MKKYSIIIILAVILAGAADLNAHCEIPCGIYGDSTRIELIREHITTIEKSMDMIRKLEAGEKTEYNQLVRWIVNKEEHASKLQQIVSQYFMTQRIKPETEKYAEKLSLLHRMLIHAMKCKQTTDPKEVEELRSLTDQFAILYHGHK